MFNNEETISKAINGKYLHNMNRVEEVLADRKGLSYEGLRIDLIKNAFRIGRKVYFSKEFSLELLPKSRQGWQAAAVLEMLNKLLSHFGIIGLTDLNSFNKDTINKKVIKEIEEHIPPIIVSLLPDESIHVDDGNHRVALAKFFLGHKNIRAFILV